eukprot:gene10843-10998_t
MQSTPLSSPVTRLDRILELVTSHEESYREQDIRLSEVVQRMAELERRLAQEMAPFWVFKERDICKELDLARAAVESLVQQSMQQELSSSSCSLREDAARQAAAAASAVEGWVRDELLQATAKLKAVVSSCSNHQHQVNRQMEALQLQWSNTSAALAALQQEDRKLKKQLMKLTSGHEECQRLSQEAVASEVALQQVRNDINQLHAAQQQSNTQSKVSSR